MNRTTSGAVALLIGSLVLLVPVLVAPLPPMGDYPNHLARLWLLSSDAGQAAMAPFYRIQFDTFTNIGIDLIALTVGKVAGYMAAGRLAVALAVLLPPLGGAVLWWSIHRRAHWWMLSFGLLAWGSITINGFLNYQIAIGLALLFAALEPALVRRGIAVQILVRALLSVVLLLAHPFGLLFYALLLAALAVGPRLAPRDWPAAFVRLLPAIGSILLVAVLFVVFVPSLPGAQEKSSLGTLPHEVAVGLAEFRHNPARKLSNVLFAFRAYNNLVDGLTALLFFAPLALAALFRGLRAHAGLLLLSAALLLIYLLCPASCSAPAGSMAGSRS